MPQAFLREIRDIRRDLHAHPELGFAVDRTAALVAAELAALGLEVVTGIGGSGVVGTLRRGAAARAIGLRADMDALPMTEQSGVDHSSRIDGAFHGCGHDGHTAMLLGAARQLVATPNLSGIIHFIFQPAEEGLGGARVMIEDGLFARFPCDLVFALHNWPGLPVGSAQSRAGPIMAAADRFDIVVSGRGGHAAMPSLSVDTIQAASALVGALNTIVSRRIHAFESAVLSVTRIVGGYSHNILPERVSLTGTVRTFDAGVQDRIEAAIRDVSAGIGRAYEVTVEVCYDRYYPATVNDSKAVDIALAAARKICADVSVAPEPAFTSEDFAFMLQARPGAYLWLGQGGTGFEAPLHNPAYDFNDAALPFGIGWFVALAQDLLGG